MGHIRIKKTDAGYRLVRTTRAFSGARMVVPGSLTNVLNKGEITEQLAVFQKNPVKPPGLGS